MERSVRSVTMALVVLVACVVLPFMSGCQSCQNGIQDRAESCPEFAAVSPSMIGAAEVDRSVTMRATYLKGSTTGQRLSPELRVYKFDGTPVTAMNELALLFEPGYGTSVIVGNSGLSTFEFAVARVKQTVPYSFFVGFRLTVTKASGGVCTVPVVGTVHVFSYDIGSQSSSPDPKDPTGSRDQPVAESCPEFLNRTPNVREYHSGDTIGLKFFRAGHECSASASNIRLTYTIFEDLGNGSFTSVSKEEAFGTTGLDLVRESGHALRCQPTTKTRRVLIEATCANVCPGKQLATKPTGFSIVP